MQGQHRITAKRAEFLALRRRASRSVFMLLAMAVVATFLIALAYIFPPDSGFQHDSVKAAFMTISLTAFWILFAVAFSALRHLTPFYADETLFLPIARRPWLESRPLRYDDNDGASIETNQDGSWSMWFTLRGGGLAILHETPDIPHEACDFIIEQLKRRDVFLEFE